MRGGLLRATHLQHQQHLHDGGRHAGVGAGQRVLQLHAEGDGVPEVQQGQLADRRLLALVTQDTTRPRSGARRENGPAGPQARRGLVSHTEPPLCAGRALLCAALGFTEPLGGSCPHFHLMGGWQVLRHAQVQTAVTAVRGRRVCPSSGRAVCSEARRADMVAQGSHGCRGHSPAQGRK